MKDKVRIAKNTGILMLMKIGIQILQVAVSVVLARYLLPKGYGVWAFAMSFVALFNIVPGLGISTLTTRELARDTKSLPSFLSNGMTMILFLGTLTIAGIQALAYILNFGVEKQHIVLLAALIMVSEVILRFACSFFRSQQEISTVARLHMTYFCSLSVCALAVVFMKGSIIAILWARVAVSFFTISYALWRVQMRFHPTWRFDPKGAITLARSSLPFMLNQMFIRVYVRLDVVMLSFMRGDVVTGWYAIAHRFHQALAFIPLSVTGAAFPALAKYAHESERKLRETVHRSCKYMWLVALPAAAIISLLADHLVYLLFGAAYASAATSLRILIWAVVFAFPNNVLTSTLTATGNEKKVTLALAFGAVFSVTTNLIAIPIWAHAGAAAATVISEAVVFCIQLELLRRAIPGIQPLNEIVRPLGAIFCMFITSWVMSGFHWFLIGAASLFVYLLALILLKAIGSDEWHLVSSMLTYKAKRKAGS